MVGGLGGEGWGWQKKLRRGRGGESRSCDFSQKLKFWAVIGSWKQLPSACRNGRWLPTEASGQKPSLRLRCHPLLQIRSSVIVSWRQVVKVTLMLRGKPSERSQEDLFALPRGFAPWMDRNLIHKEPKAVLLQPPPHHTAREKP